MSIWQLTYKQSVFKRYHSDKHLSEFLPTRWRQKLTGIDTEQNYVTVTVCIVIMQRLTRHDESQVQVSTVADRPARRADSRVVL